MNVVFFGSSKPILPVIEVLKGNFNLSLVITAEKADGVVPSFCRKNNIPFVSVENLKKSKNLILKTKADVAVVADFGLIIPEEILNAYPKGIINIHPSLLPKYRGPLPVQKAILEGDKITGVSIIKLDKEIDHGPILGQIQEEILDNDTSEALYLRLFDIGANLLSKVLDKYLKDGLKLIPQKHENATFTKVLTRKDGYVNLETIKTKNEKLSLEKMIRAYYPWPGVWTKVKLNDKEKIVKLLPKDEIQVEGKRPMSYKDFSNGYSEGKEILKIIS